MMRKTYTVMLALTLGFSAVIGNSAFAGGLSDAIVEEPQIIAPPAQAAESNLPGWVVPAIALALLGAAAASSGGGGGGSSDSDASGGAPPILGDVK